ncbi:MAG TPA: glycosyltransferase [Thermoleophilaceae bacterium]|jgi:glycosyltransferase involved in cell wall biosynthesis
MITGRDFIFLSSIEWEPLWQAHQELASRLAKAGNRVLYIENTGVRHPRLRDVSRLVSRMRKWTATLGSHGLREVAPGLYVCSPLVLAPFGSRPTRAFNRRVLIPRIARRAELLGMRDPIVWTYLPTDTAAALIDRLRTPRGLVVYSCLADFSQLTPRSEGLARWEPKILRDSDLVLAQGGLARRCERFSENVHPFPIGVSLEAFTKPYGQGSESLLRRLDATPRPRVGYVGGLHRHVNMGLLVEMARARPDWSWVYVGPRQEGFAELDRLGNVHMLGAVPHGQLAPLIAGFDVGMVPYRDSEFVHTAVPTKIMEYLAMGKPVVSTGMPVARDLEDRTGVVMTAPSEAGGFLAALERALALPPDGAQRRAVAAERGWDREVGRIGELIAERL